MSLTRGQIRDLARTFLSESSASYWSDSELNTWVNLGLDDFCTSTEILEGIYTDSIVQYQADYNWPTDIIKIKKIETTKGNTVYLCYKEDLYEHYTGIVKTTSSPPFGVNVFADKIRLRERPSAAAASTTLSSAISSTSATSIALTDSSSFPRMGRILIDSEVIHYWNNSSNTLSPCERGVEGSTAATHSNGATVTNRDIWIYGVKKNGDLSSDSSTPSVASVFHQAFAHYAAWIGRQKSKDWDLANNNKGVYDEFVAKGQIYAKEKWKKVGKVK